MKKLIHHVFLLTSFIFVINCLLTLTASSQWTSVGGNPTFSNTYAPHYSFAKDKKDTLYIAFADNANAYQVTVKKQSGGGSWQTVGVPGFITGSALFYYPGTSIAVNPVNNRPYIAISDGDHGNRLSVMEFNGTSWQYVGPPGFSPPNACGVKLVFTSTGIPYVAFNDCYNGSGISVMRFTGSWTYAGAPNFASGNYMQLVASPDNTLSIAFKDHSVAGKISVMRLLGSWTYAGSAGFSDDVAEHISIAADANNALYVSYSDYSHSYKLTVKKLVANIWTVLGTPYFSSFDAKYTDLNINASGIPYVSYVDGSFTVVQKYKNGNWSRLGNYVVTTACHYTSLVNDTLGNPYVLMALQPSSTLPFVYKYSPCNDADYNFIANAQQDSAITQPGGTTTVKVAATGGVGPYTGTGTFTVPSGYYTYTITDRNGCSTTVDINVTEPCTQNYWYGFINNLWEEPGNWSCGTVPNIDSDVFITFGTVVVNTSASVRSLQVDPDASFIVGAGVTLSITH